MTMWNRRRVKHQAHIRTAGFTLLEVLIAVAIVAIALVTFMGLHLRSLDATIRAQDLTTAVLLAQAKMATMGEFPDTGEEKGQFEGPELARFQWATAVTEHTLDAAASGSNGRLGRWAAAPSLHAGSIWGTVKVLARSGPLREKRALPWSSCSWPYFCLPSLPGWSLRHLPPWPVGWRKAGSI